MNIGLRDRNLNQSLTSVERVTGSMPGRREESHLLTYSPHEAEAPGKPQLSRTSGRLSAFKLRLYQIQRNMFLGQLPLKVLGSA